jgi:hypothetical protein
VIVKDKLFIGGHWVAPSTADTVDVVGAATEEVLARVPDGARPDMDKAVAAAREAFDNGPWPRRSGLERRSGRDRRGGPDPDGIRRPLRRSRQPLTQPAGCRRRRRIA